MVLIGHGPYSKVHRVVTYKLRGDVNTKGGRRKLGKNTSSDFLVCFVVGWCIARLGLVLPWRFLLLQLLRYIWLVLCPILAQASCT